MRTIAFITLWLSLVRWAQAVPNPANDFVESKPVVIDGLEFASVTHPIWSTVRRKDGANPIEVELRVTNRADRVIAFSLFDTCRLKIETADGKTTWCNFNRTWTTWPVPLFLQPGETEYISGKATLERDKGSKGMMFTYEDATSGGMFAGPLLSAKYELLFFLDGTAPFPKVLARQYAHPEKLPLWKGQGATLPVSFEIEE